MISASLGMNEHPSKISSEFAARLARLKPGVKLHAIVMLRTPKPDPAFLERRPSQQERQEAVERVRGVASEALTDVDNILNRYDGRRLSEAPSALGTIPVETTVAGLTALAGSSHVKAILEDQPISGLRLPNQK